MRERGWPEHWVRWLEWAEVLMPVDASRVVEASGALSGTVGTVLTVLNGFS